MPPWSWCSNGSTTSDATGPVLAVLGDEHGRKPGLTLGEGESLRGLFGHAHAASGLPARAAAALCCGHRVLPAAPGAERITPWKGKRRSALPS